MRCAWLTGRQPAGIVTIVAVLAGVACVAQLVTRRPQRTGNRDLRSLSVRDFSVDGVRVGMKLDAVRSILGPLRQRRSTGRGRECVCLLSGEPTGYPTDVSFRDRRVYSVFGSSLGVGGRTFPSGVSCATLARGLGVERSLLPGFSFFTCDSDFRALRLSDGVISLWTTRGAIDCYAIDGSTGPIGSSEKPAEARRAPRSASTANEVRGKRTLGRGRPPSKNRRATTSTSRPPGQR